MIVTTKYFCFQAKLHFSRWNGPWQNHSVHYISVWNPPDWYKRPFPDHSSTFHYNKLGEGIPHVDWPERCGVPRKYDQQADDPAVWDVLQGLPGIVMSRVCSNSPQTWLRWQQWQGHLTLSVVFIVVKVTSRSRMLHVSIFSKCLLGKFSGSVCSKMYVLFHCAE